jgi:peroxiredoxin
MRSLHVLILLVAAPVFAGEFNDVLSPGDPAPAWVDLPGTDGKKHSLADLKAKDVVVVVFTCNSCPAAVDYEDRILAFTKKHTGPDKKVALVAINVNTLEEDSLPEMVKRAATRKFDFPYLYDETQKIAKLYGATYTPEFFVLNKERRVVYMGAWDDRDDPKNVKVHYLEDAVAAALKGVRPPTSESLARGCKIRYVRKKK